MKSTFLYSALSLLLCSLSSLATEILASGEIGKLSDDKNKIIFTKAPSDILDYVGAVPIIKDPSPTKIIKIEGFTGYFLVGGLRECYYRGRFSYHMPPTFNAPIGIGAKIFLGNDGEVPVLAGTINPKGLFIIHLPPNLLKKKTYIYFGGSSSDKPKNDFKITRKWSSDNQTQKMDLDVYTIRALIITPIKMQPPKASFSSER